MNAPLPLAQAFEHIPLADLCPSPTNPRRTFDAEKLQDMASSIARHGVLQPILVRPWPAGQAVRLNEAPFDLDKPDLLPDAGPCSTCPSRSGNQPELFAYISGSDVCTDPGCYQRKREAWAELRRAEATAAGHKVLTGKAAEKIIPAYCFGPQAGYVRLDDRCANALPVRDIPPEPTEPEGDEDEDSPEWQAYWKACDEWEEQQEAALPTYRELLAGESVAVIFVQHPRSGDIVECAEQSKILPVLQAKNALEKTPATADKFSRANDQRELETKARAETNYRKLLLRRVLETRAGEPLQDIELAVIAKAFLDAAGNSVASKCAVDTVGASCYSELLESMPTRTPSEITRVLLALALSDGVEVQYWNFNTREATELFAAAERAGIDAAAVKKESAKPVFPPTPKAKAKAKAKGKKKPATE